MIRPVAAALALLLAAPLTGCGGSGSSPSASATSAEALMTMIPVEATGVFYVDIQKALATPALRSALEDKTDKVREFTESTGLTPDDLTALAGYVVGTGKDSKEGGIILAGKSFDRDRLLAKAREKNPDLEPVEYEGVAMAPLPRSDDQDEGKAPSWAAFLDHSTLAFGFESDVKKIVDVRAKRVPSVVHNPGVMDLVEKTETSSMGWGAFTVSATAADQLAEAPMMGQLKGLRSLTLAVDYGEKTLSGRIRIQGADAKKNQEIAGFLRMITGFLSMGSSEHPEVAELIQAIRIEPGPEHVAVNVDIPQDLLDRLAAAARKKDSASLVPGN